jgi:hypothetical protein
LSVSPYIPGDIEQLGTLYDVTAADRSASESQLASMPEELLSHYARTLRLEGDPIACFGVWPLHAGVGRAWSVLTTLSLQKPKLLYSSVLRQLVRFERDEGLIRIESVVRVGHPTAHDWIQHLGFSRETLDGGMRCYGISGEAYHLYARIREEH